MLFLISRFFRVRVLISLSFCAVATWVSGCNRSAPEAAAAAGAPAPVASAPAASPAPAATTTTTTTATATATAPAPRRSGEGERPRQSTLERVPVETAPIVRGPISAFLPFNTTLETEAVVDIFPQTTGQVEALLVEEGKIVKAGDPLLKIEDTEMRIDADESRANYEQLKRNFSRSEELFASKLINKQDYETQSYQLEQARLRYERANLRHSYTTVRAPFDGVISSREAQVGARVATGTKLFSMVKLDEIVGRVFVPGRYLSVVKLDQPAVVTSEFLADRVFKGWVKRISPVIDPKSGTFKVTVGVRGDRPAELPPGLFVSVRIVTDTRPEAVLVPKRAIVYEGGERYFFTVANEIASKRKLQAGYEDPQNIEAVAGVEPGTHVIVVGHAGLKDGAAVRTVNALAPVPVSPEPGLAKDVPAPAVSAKKS
ncbi:MAG: efflux RND transporter periplasmic adaptor subunit [Opitutaceae bacterium]|nr:efflux RND transporter periplasmic adaptor subunit [Opitutaceae bacterium]